MQNILIFKIYIYINFFFHANILYTEKYSPSFYFAPFAFVVSGRTKDLANFNVKTLYGRIQDGMKLLQARQSKITQDEYFPVYNTTCTCFEIHVFLVSGYFNYTYGQPGDSPVTKCFQIDYEPDISKEQIQVGC